MYGGIVQFYDFIFNLVTVSELFLLKYFLANRMRWWVQRGPLRCFSNQ